LHLLRRSDQTVDGAALQQQNAHLATAGIGMDHAAMAA
jgi:hypothetical protein